MTRSIDLRRLQESLRALAQPLQTRNLLLPNRFAMAPMTRLNSPGGAPTAENANHYAARAAGGVGTIITEGILLDDPSAGFSHRIPRLNAPDSQAGWIALVQAVKGHGSRIIAQLWHTGGARGESPSYHPTSAPRSPSGLGLDGERIGPALSVDQMERLVGDYAQSAVRAQQLGFDGVEIHGAHGYLLDEFLWSRTNRRADEYGLATRSGTTFPAQVVRAVRAAVGPGYPILYRFSQWKVGHYDEVNVRTPDQLEALLAPLIEAGVDVFHVSARRHWTATFGEETTLAGWTRRVSGLPVIAVGSVGIESQFGESVSERQVDLEGHCLRLTSSFEKGEFDVIAIGRALLGDPGLINKILNGDYAGVQIYKKQGSSRSKPRTA